ncbi:heavy metal sensor histidine kinase [Halopseudomonas pelagia]|uniref:heavy metal sensor histidine kinase n=1 Tax=Halopseudomonas pelagia TaxID=553151 RepID=UPI0030D98F77|tara:strand:- start:4811 stop:6217 length:1407 start_codon:yes stop_codon:yes gene_type:complete
MKPPSLSLRLGLSVSLMGTALVIILAVLTYAILNYQLDLIAKNNLAGKLKQVEHSLNDDMTARLLLQHPHALLDMVMGHDNLSLTVYTLKPRSTILLAAGDESLIRKLPDISVSDNSEFTAWIDDKGTDFLTASKIMLLNDGNAVKVLLTVDRFEDTTLLGMYLKSALLFFPALLALIGFGSWWIVRRGLTPLSRFRHIASLVSAQDLTHRISTEQLPQELSDLAHAINFMLHRLDDEVQQLSQFSDDLAHELRSPISNLMGKAQVTLSKKRPPEEYKLVLECCTEELERVSRIVSDMLFLAQTNHPASLIPFEPVQLEHEAARLIELFSLPAEEKQIGLNMDGAGIVLGDRLMIQRAISNLLSNAIRHSPIMSNVHLTIERRQQTISLAVSNTGEGIPAQHLPHLFERFYRVDPSRSRSEGGTGLGLAIIRSIMSLHGGSAKVSSIPGGVTVFSLIFPVVEKPPIPY